MQFSAAGVCRSACIFVAFALALLLSAATFAQETTGGIKGYVKDKSGAVVPGASVELTSPALLVSKKAESDGAGYFYFALLPPGDYSLTVTAPNFHTFKQTGIPLSVGQLPTLEITLEVGSVAETVEVTGKPPIVDVTQSKVAVTVTEDVFDNVPKGRSYQSLITFAPGARQEPLQSPRNNNGRNNGFQIDGASDSENTYLVEGLDTSEINSGGIKQNVVFEFVQEVQVKTSGLEAEYGGAVGGVVNVVQKRGSNEWHGSLFAHYQADPLNSNDQCAVTPFSNTSEAPNALSGQQLACGLRADPSTSVDSTNRLDQAAQYYQQKKDKFFIAEPGFEVGGPILKDKLWLFTSYVPTIERVTRTVNFTGTNPGVRSFTTNYEQQNALNRLDYQVYSKLHLYGSWQYGYSRATGQLPTTPDSQTGQVNTIATTNPTNFRNDTGDVYPSNIFNFGGDWTPNSKLVISARYGYFFYNTEDRGKPSGIRYIYQNSLNPGDCVPADPTKPCATTDLNGSPLVATSNAFTLPGGFSNISSNLQTIFDAFKRKAFASDVSYSVSKWGQHTFKFGYGFNRLANDLLVGYNTAQISLYYGAKYTPGTTEGDTNCAQIISQNQTTYGLSAGQANTAGCRGNAGYFVVDDGVDSAGNVSSLNHGIYGQDSWTVGHGLTLNLGVRFDKEYLPPYGVGASSISFGFTDKVAPRLGAAYDLFHNGKVKIYGSYGKFYDIMKYSLPRGSFGGEYWHQCVYAMDFIDYTTITPTAPNNHACPTSGPSDGVTVGRFIENQDLRRNIINTDDPGVDPNIKPMSQHEFVVGSDWAITPSLGLEVRYSRKRLDNTIEDMGVTDNYGFYIGNPGSVYGDLLHRPLPGSDLPAICPDCPKQPKAIRRYDGLEVRMNRRGRNFFGQLTYTYSSLTGNYAGLTNTDIADGNGGRHSPNNHRDFDHPDMQFTTGGVLQDGPLATDRPHVLGGVGYYRIKWWGMETTFGINQIFASGTPKSTCFATIVSGSSCQFFDQRGDFVDITRDPSTGDFVEGTVHKGARTPTYSQTDFNFGHEFRVSKSHEQMRLGFQWNILNLFNQDAPLSYNPVPFQGSGAAKPVDPQCPTGSPLPDCTANPSRIDFKTLMTGWDPFAAANAQAYGITSPLTLSNRYGLPFLFQTRRTMRLDVRFTF